MTRKRKWLALALSGTSLLFLVGWAYFFFTPLCAFDTNTNHLELKNHRVTYEGIVAAVMKQPLPKEGKAWFLLPSTGAASELKPYPMKSLPLGNSEKIVTVEVKSTGRTLIWIVTYPGGHFGQYYLVFCTRQPVMDEDFGIYQQGVQLDDHWWSVEDHSS